MLSISILRRLRSRTTDTHYFLLLFFFGVGGIFFFFGTIGYCLVYTIERELS